MRDTDNVICSPSLCPWKLNLLRFELMDLVLCHSSYGDEDKEARIEGKTCFNSMDKRQWNDSVLVFRAFDFQSRTVPA